MTVSGPGTTLRLAAALLVAFAIIGGGVAHAAPPERFTVSPTRPIAGESADYIADADLGCGPLPVATCTWTFGDGSDSGPTVSHTYATAGTKTVTLVVTDLLSFVVTYNETAEVDVDPAPPPNQPPVASFTFAPQSPNIGQSVDFTSTSSDPDAGDTLTYAWDLDGDNAFDDATGPTASQSFETAGSKTVGLRVTDGDGASDIQTETVDVNAPPTITAITGPATVQEGSSASFSTSANEAVTFAWAVDGTPLADTGSSITKTLSAGDHTISVQATDADGATSSVRTKPVFVNRPPVASFTSSPSAPVVGQPVSFISTASDPDAGDTLTFAWDLNGDKMFNDANGPTATHVYTTAGSRTVTLRVTDGRGGLVTPFKSIDVAPAPQTPSTGPVQTKESVATLLSPFPRVRYAGRLTRRGAKITLLVVRAPRGAQIKAACSKRCPASGAKVTAKTTGDFRLTKLRGNYTSGAMLRISVTKANRIGKYTQISIKRGKAPKRIDRCLFPSSKIPKKCP